MWQTQLFGERFFLSSFLIVVAVAVADTALVVVVARHFGISIWLLWLNKRANSKHCSSSCRFFQTI